MESQENVYNELIHKLELNEESHIDKKIKKQKKIIASATKHLRRLALDKISNRVGEC